MVHLWPKRLRASFPPSPLTIKGLGPRGHARVSTRSGVYGVQLVTAFAQCIRTETSTKGGKDRKRDVSRLLDLDLVLGVLLLRRVEDVDVPLGRVRLWHIETCGLLLADLVDLGNLIVGERDDLEVRLDARRGNRLGNDCGRAENGDQHTVPHIEVYTEASQPVESEKAQGEGTYWRGRRACPRR